MMFTEVDYDEVLEIDGGLVLTATAIFGGVIVASASLSAFIYSIVK